MSIVTITNESIIEFKNLLLDYHNQFIQERNPSGIKNYFFSEMKDISSAEANQAVIPASTGSGNTWNINMFNNFIKNCVHYKISTDFNNLYIPLKPKKIASGNPVADENNLKDIGRQLNVLNVIIDILEAYKSFIDTEDIQFKNMILNVNSIMLVNKHSRPPYGANNKLTTNPNHGYIHSDSNLGGINTLVLSIVSLNKVNRVFTLSGATYTNGSITSEGSNNLEITTNEGFIVDGKVADNKKTFLRQSVSASESGGTIQIKHNGSGSERTYLSDDPTESASQKQNPDERDKELLQNVLHFLMKITYSQKDSVRTQVYALYYYYKIIRIYIYNVLTYTNLAVNNITLSSGTINEIKVTDLAFVLDTSYSEYVTNFLRPIYGKTADDTDINYENSISVPTQTSSGTKQSLKDSIIKIDEWSRFQLEKIEEDLFVNSNSNKMDSALIYIINKAIAFKINKSDYANANSDTIKLNYSTVGLVNNIAAVIRNQITKSYMLNHLVIVKDGIQYDIVGVNQGDDDADKYILIKARFLDNSIAEKQDIPAIPFQYSTMTAGDINFEAILLSKSLFTLKREYTFNKGRLRNINNDIRYNTVKINNQKSLFGVQKNRYDLLKNQVLAYSIILGALFVSFLFVLTYNFDVATKKMISFIFSGIIVLIIVIYYILNASYIEEKFTNSNYDNKQIIEKFEDIGFKTLTEVINTNNLSSGYNVKKLYFIRDKLAGLQNSCSTVLQKTLSMVPLRETQDFYSELNLVMKMETTEKSNIKDILTYKHSLGNSQIDIMKYEIHNMKIYLFVLLATAGIFSLLYMMSLFIPPDYSSLLMFIAFIIAVVMFAYYLIFTHYLVRTKSMHKYWGPMFNDDF